MGDPPLFEGDVFLELQLRMQSKYFDMEYWLTVGAVVADDLPRDFSSAVD
ncbi:hypothetical protein [Roseinatronobacter alkalisoli]|uniref:Uncharacterized protein n=1 Tax=Roseinatronobacter alkalisoli TaxID=3028235 RepID=A0ABT5TDS2_9RHOB|nr:hypothetical protein [Roseinatronobacter sp. HJB301]MDD7973254.1 hypothetical protein [Roseinatronobacter sp. HJB301]